MSQHAHQSTCGVARADPDSYHWNLTNAQSLFGVEGIASAKVTFLCYSSIKQSSMCHRHVTSSLVSNLVSQTHYLALTGRIARAQRCMCTASEVALSNGSINFKRRIVVLTLTIHNGSLYSKKFSHQAHSIKSIQTRCAAKRRLRRPLCPCTF